jgi:hypothetical protein
MRVTLEIVSGPHQGRKLVVGSGHVVQVGRTEWADFALPEDGHLSAVHFVVECSQRECRIRDLKSTNGTLVSGNRVTETVLADGDTIQAGQTTFVVRIEGSDSLRSTTPANPAASFRAGIEDHDPAVRREALLTAAWTRQPWLLEHCRKLAAHPNPDHWDAIHLLAVLGKPQDLPRMLAIGRAAERGPRRFELLGAYGHPAVVDVLLEAMAGQDPESAAAAFTKITGVEVDSDRRVQRPPSDRGEPETLQREGLLETVLPDVDRARAHWGQLKPKLSHSTRCCRGFDLSQGASEEAMSHLDMQSRCEALCRGQYEGAWRINLSELESLKPRE